MNAAQFGALADADGTRFALYSAIADAVELCLFDAAGHELARHALEQTGTGLWQLELAGCQAGQHYGYRVHGPYDPAAGLRCNPNKLLIDPWARQLDGAFVWDDAVTGYAGSDPLHDAPCARDSAAFVPKSVVSGELPPLQVARPGLAWQDAVICELNVRGYTMCHPDLSEAERGRFSGLTNGQILAHLKALGITMVELLPVHAFIDERFLHARGLRNYWGYNSINFFTPAGRYATADAVAEFRLMVDAIHEAGLEVLLDVVYNHTGETDEYGPTLSLRGIDNQAYYRTSHDAPHRYVNDTGCGNTLNADHPVVQRLVLDSLEYWHAAMGVDGFRFDLAPVLGRHADGFAADHPLLRALESSPVLQQARLVAEPWDIGPDGYQAGNFGPRWAEWNDAFRDSVRRFWRGDAGETGDFARAVHGTADRYEHNGRGPTASVNFLTSHDGYTLLDLVSYAERHNEANGENNRDGHSHNFSINHGHEGVTDDSQINARRRRQRLNMLATLLVSGGTPMLLAGDEFGHTQNGNNNAYCQDNATTWLDWGGLAADPDFFAQVKAWIELRRSQPLLKPANYRHGSAEIRWLQPDGQPMTDTSWETARAFVMVCSDPDTNVVGQVAGQVAVLFNATGAAVCFTLPTASWQLLLATESATAEGNVVELSADSVAVCLCDAVA